ncbi:TetR/AcrR family transcriptional regulator [Streptomyces sp. NPDC004539]|uniref:TetR/AcrR family transcriptional regulator n=1 Tax=Streptomyces sp. NPDC004539 TaxID=3154280 RepID=UPI0033B84AE6
MTSTTTAARGRIDKRQAILEAAFDVFARRGYAQACVKEIAEAAKVAKPTVYNHLNDKETLFRQALERAADAVAADAVAALDPLRAPGDDPRAAFLDTARRLLAVFTADRARSLRWLTYAQVGVFPDLVETVTSRTQTRLAESLADRLARLALSGHLHRTDPTTAAEHFLALLTGPLEHRSALGTREVTPAEVEAVAEAGVKVFLRAYGAR